MRQRRGVIYHVPPLPQKNPTDVATCLQRRNVMNHAPSVYANKFNKKTVISIHTADICRHVVVR